MKNITMLYLMEPHSFESAKEGHEQYNEEPLVSEILDKIIYDDVEYNLYKINTNSINMVFYADAAASMDGNVVKNRFTGECCYLPDSLEQLFNRHTKSTTTNEWRIKPSEPVYEYQWYRVHSDTNKAYISKFITDEEADEANKFAKYEYWIKRIEETKRVRNA